MLELRGLFGGKISEGLALLIVQDIQHICRDAREKSRIVPLLGDINIAHILKSKEIAHLARRHEGGCAEITGEEGQSAESDGAELCTVRDCLRNCIAALLSTSTRLRAAVRVLWAFTRTILGALVAPANPARRRRQVAQLVGVESGCHDALCHSRPGPEARLAERFLDGSRFFGRERIRIVLGKDGLHLLFLRVGERLGYPRPVPAAFVAWAAFARGRALPVARRVSVLCCEEARQRAECQREKNDSGFHITLCFDRIYCQFSVPAVCTVSSCPRG